MDQITQSTKTDGDFGLDLLSLDCCLLTDLVEISITLQVLAVVEISCGIEGIFKEFMHAFIRGTFLFQLRHLVHVLLLKCATQR